MESYLYREDYSCAIELYRKIWHAFIARTDLEVNWDRLKAGYLIYSIMAFASHRNVGKSISSEEIAEDSDVLYEQGAHLIMCLEAETAQGGDDEDAPGARFHEIRAYILAHLHDQQLTLGTVSSHFQLSQSMLNKMFLKYESQKPLEFIHRSRISEAKRLLKEGMTGREVAAAVGYTRGKALSCAFKRYEGITPGEYKKLWK